MTLADARRGLFVLAVLALFGGCARGSVEDAGVRLDGGRSDAAPPRPDAGGCRVDCSTLAAAPCSMFVCNDGSLPGAAGECVMVPAPDGAACDDGDFCTIGDACAAGACSGDPNDCGMTAGACEEIVCDAAAARCTVEPATAMNGMPCTPADRCIAGATCAEGACTGGAPLDCSSTPTPNECQAAACNPATGACELSPANEGGACTDSTDRCRAGTTCAGGTCGGGTTTDCSAMESDCTLGVCNPADGSCTAMPFNEGGGCDDGDACTSGSVCTSGVCGGGTAPPCSSTLDGCCPSACSSANDADCACPGIMVGGTCVYLPTTASAASQTGARSACTALGAGWDLCSASMLCMTATRSYLASSGCSCSGGASTCACGSASNIYVHVSGTSSPYYVRGAEFPTCLSSSSCTTSVSEVCGVALCCR